MSKFSDQTVFAAFQPYLQDGEFLGNAAYCVYSPPQLLGCLFFLIGWLPGLLYTALLSRFYVVGLTNHNFIVLRLASRFGENIQVADIFGYSLDQLPETQATFGGFGNWNLKIKDPAKPLKVGFPSRGVPDNYQRGQMIANALLSHWQQRQLPTSERTLQSQAIPSAAPLLRSVPAGSAPIAERAQFSPQMRPTTYVSQSSHKTFGCLGTAMITVGAGILLLCALGFLGFLLDEKKTSQDVTAGLVAFSVLLLFSATVIAIGIYLVVHGRKEKAAAMSLQRTQANTSVTGQMPRQFPESQPVTGQTETSQTITLWAKDQQTADSLSNDQYFLYGALMADTTPEVKQFLDAWGRGGSLSHEVLPNAKKGGYDVKITLHGASALSLAHQQEQPSESEPQPEPTLGQVTGFRTESVNSSEVLPGQPQPEEDPLSQKEDARGPSCDHEWTRVVDQEGARSLRVYTKCTKCGEVMKPTKTVHYDMR